MAFSPTQLAIWVRNGEGGLPRALNANPEMSVLYWDGATRSAITFQGRGQLASDEQTRNRVFERMPEQEQNHDPERNGVALIIEVSEMVAWGPQGFYLMRPEL